MDEKLLAALQILQTHANAIRRLKEMHIALADLVRQIEEEKGVLYEEFEKRYLDAVVRAEKSGPHYDPQGVAKEIEEAVETLAMLQKQYFRN